MPRGSLVWLSCRSRVTQRRRLPACAPSALGPLHGRWGLGCSGAPWLLGVPWHTPASGPCTCWGCCWRAHVAALLGFPPPAFSGGSPQPGRGPPPGPSSLLCVCPACLCPVCPGAGSHAVSLRRGGQGRKTPAPEGTEQLIAATLLCGSTRRRFARVESPNHGVWRFISPSGLSTWSLVARLRGRWPESCRPRCAERRADSVCCPLRSPARRPCGSRALLLSPDLSTEPGTGQGSVSE